MVSHAFLAAILLAAFSLAPVLGADPGTKPATKKAGGARSAPSERTCALTITWWTAPTLAEGESLELGVQTDHGVTLIGPGTMNMSGTILYEGPAQVAIVRRSLAPNPNGKPGAAPVEAWLPFATFAVGENDQEALALLFAVEGTNKVMARTFNINVDTFPFGGFEVLNLSKSRLLCSMAGKVFYAEPTKRARSPVVIQRREVVNFYMGVTDANGAQKIIYRAPLILNEKLRRLYFVQESPVESSKGFVSHTLIQHVMGHETVASLKAKAAGDLPDGAKKTGDDTPKPAESKSEVVKTVGA
ncbi:MAG: hypothetical protein CAK86_01330 [Opitutia bacterium AMD-G1]|nr:MAG: hypothetical protein CAK86_01330 [Opitutae bacterium AMD-G1]